MTILYTALVSFALALVLGFLLGFFKKIFAVHVDPLESEIRATLPGANCGACGYPGCDGFASGVATGKAPVDGCSAGGTATAKAVAKLMGVEASGQQNIVVLACNGSKDHATVKGEYVGIKNCRAAKLAINGIKMCGWGCMGFGDCVAVCRFGAIKIGEGGIPVIDKVQCTGCGMCVNACPQKLLSKVPAARKGAIVICSNRSQNKPSVSKNCKTGCFKCGKCERNCKQKALVLKYGLPVIDYELCNFCGDCITGCPAHALKLLES